jgi:NAD(P)-dependent dehydrogenase (short-subunit alcohol dehydrogenase family)
LIALTCDILLARGGLGLAGRPRRRDRETPADNHRVSRIFITGSVDGLGRAAAAELLDEGHDVVLHARSRQRAEALDGLAARAAGVVIGDLSSAAQTRAVADQVNDIGRMDAVIHNAGVYTGADILPVNVLAVYLLTCLISRPGRLVYLSSGMHRGGRATLAALDGTHRRGPVSYSDSKLFVATLAAAVARHWPDVFSNAVDPGWVPTRMGGPGASDDLRLGHVTQVWLAVDEDPRARTSGRYWYHMRPQAAHPLVLDEGFQERLLGVLARLTATQLP